MWCPVKWCIVTRHCLRSMTSSRVWVKGYVYERDASRVELGQPAQVDFVAYPELEANGKVVRISPLMDDNEPVLPIWVEVANPDHLLKDGMLAQVTCWRSQRNRSIRRFSATRRLAGDRFVDES